MNEREPKYNIVFDTSGKAYVSPTDKPERKGLIDELKTQGLSPEEREELFERLNSRYSATGEGMRTAIDRTHEDVNSPTL